MDDFSDEFELMSILTPQQAEVLVVGAGENLWLYNLTEVSPDVAKVLAKHKGNLYFSRLATLTPEAAVSLAKQKGEHLALDALTTLSDSTAEELAKYKGKYLSLSGLTALSDNAARALATYRGGLELDGLNTLSIAAATSLGGHRNFLSLGGLTTLADASLKALAHHTGNLSLDGLSTLTIAGAEALAICPGNLSLGGITTLAERAAEILAQRRWRIFGDWPENPPSILQNHPLFAPAQENDPRPISADFASRVTFREVPGMITNSIGIRLVPLAPGTFTMGSPENEEWHFEDERQHEVILSKTFFLGVTQVTQAQYKKVMHDNPSYFRGDKIGGDSSNHPVEQVSWDAAVEFCRRLSDLPEEKSAGRVYRLPTEAEWEYACRAGSTSAYSYGDDAASLRYHGWSLQNSENQTHPVGQKNPNAWGLQDMHGNVWEWCADGYVAEYPSISVTDPRSPENCSLRVIRGGSWRTAPMCCRSAFRKWCSPTVGSLNVDFGFRIAMNPQETSG